MFEQLFRPADTVEQYQTAALVESRLRYLRHWRKLGAKRATLRRIALNQLEVVRLLDLREGSGKVSLAQVEAAAAQWALPRLRRSGKHAKPVAVADFIARATRWLSFLGRLEVPAVVARHQHVAKVAAFADWMRTERGLSEHTIHSRCWIVDEFLSRFGDEDRSLHTLTIADLDRFVAEKSASGRCTRVSICSYAIRLRIFFRYAAGHGCCVPGVAAAIMPERMYRGETVPAALAWEDVQRLLGTTEGEHPADKRDRAIVLLFAVYGLRAGEASGLRLEDIDWEHETLQVRRPKPGRTHRYPLSRNVGDALVRYLREVRPACCERACSLPSEPRSTRLLPAECRPSSTVACGVWVSSRSAEDHTRYATHARSACWTKGCRSRRSGTISDIAARPRRRYTPRSTSPHCAKWRTSTWNGWHDARRGR